MTKFFEVINVSATHIYHSALELCPVSSIIRKLYYHRRITRSPKVVIGTPESWTQTIGVSGKDCYHEICWSPCGRFIAAQTEKAVEIHNQLTMELITTLQPTETMPYLMGRFAYSPDGRSIAYAFYAAILIWDIQTGGVAKEIKCSHHSISLVWSLDGRTICTIIPEADEVTFVACTYNIPSGTASSPSALQSADIPHLWTYEKSFRIMTTVRGGGDDNAINIFEVGPTLTRIQSFTFSPLAEAEIGTFSPTTHRISISGGGALRIFDIQNSECLLNATGDYPNDCFSSDGSLFAATHSDGVHIWKYASGNYTLWGQFQCQGYSIHSLLFSPSPSSILGNLGNTLRVWRLPEFPTAPGTRQLYAGLSRSGARVATAHKKENTVTTIDLVAQTPPQYINADVEIDRLVIAGNVLLVGGSQKITAWLLTEEGLVKGVIGDRRVDCSDSIWTISQLKLGHWSWGFRVGDRVGIIEFDGYPVHVYHTETGEILDPNLVPGSSYVDWNELRDPIRGRDQLLYHDLSRRDHLRVGGWQIELQEGWVKDPEGKHRLWVPVEWRAEWSDLDWRQDVTTQFSILGGRPVIIKF